MKKLFFILLLLSGSMSFAQINYEPVILPTIPALKPNTLLKTWHGKTAPLILTIKLPKVIPLKQFSTVLSGLFWAISSFNVKISA